ncbi:MAG: LysR family transcriptional regulator [Deltaproteobacteria bacterium]|nr:LysR family transcriptional regulator [Deltaproteobacteria bacterium]
MIEEMSGDFLQWLRGFYYVSKRGSVTRAALDMRRNQATVSHQIKCLENELGVILFDRSSGDMQLTHEGRLLLNKVIPVFEIIKEMKSELSEGNLQYTGIISIVSTHALIRYFLPPFIKDFRKNSPGVHFILEGGTTGNVMERIESAEADFGIINIDDPNDEIVCRALFETGMSLIVPKNTTFSFGKNPTLKEISRAPFIIFPGSSHVTPMILKKFEENSLHLNVVLTLNNFQAIKEYVAFGLGVSILDENMVVMEDKKTLDVFPLNHIFEKRRYSLILRKGKYLSPAAKAFIRFIQPGHEFD